MSKIIAVDIDGTLTNETVGWDYATRTPNIARIIGVNKLYDKGHTIILFTARYPEDEEITRKWLADNKVKYHKLILGKPTYDVIIDDRALMPASLEFV